MFNTSINTVTKMQRSAAKTINYGILYGMGANALKANLNTPNTDNDVSKNQAIEYLDKYFENFPKLAEYLEQTKTFARKNGFTLTYWGRRRYFDTIKSKLPYLRAQAERMAINAPIQGTQADIIKLAMVETSKWLDHNRLRDDVCLLLQVHDELVFEITDNRITELVPQIISIMENVVSPAETGGVLMRAEAKIGKNWGETESFKL